VWGGGSEVFDGAKQFLCRRFFGDNVGHRSAGRTNSSETYPTPDASVYGGALRGFVDGSMDDETTTYRQQGTFRLVRNHHIQKGPFFVKPVDFTVEAATGIATSRTADKKGKIHVESEHMDLPDDLTNGFVGTLLLNMPHNTRPFRVGILAPVGGGRLIRILISPEGEQPFHATGQTLKATVFRIHPELGGIVGVIAPLIGLQPKDVMVWILEGEEPAVVRIVGQLGGYGPVVSSELEGASFGK
jgi:hypothetical protein